VYDDRGWYNETLNMFDYLDMILNEEFIDMLEWMAEEKALFPELTLEDFDKVT
jgi:hypothetical protein